MSQVPISALPPLATPLNPALQLEVAQGSTTSSKVTISQILTDPIISGSPTITDFTLALHDHSNNINGGQLTNSALIAGEFTAITGLGTQTLDLSMGIQNILQSGFLELREIALPSSPQETAGRLYTRDVAGTTTLFFLNSLGEEIDLLDIGLGTFLPLAGGTMDNLAAIEFTNTGDGNNPTISVTPSALQTLKISDNLLVPSTIFLGEAGWNMDINDADTDFVILSPTGDGSHNFDIISDNGEISLQNDTSTNDFLAKFFVEQTNAQATSQEIALTIEAKIVDGTDVGTNPVIAINALQAAASIDARPIFGIRNNGTNLWEISKDGIVNMQNNNLINSVMTSTVTGVSGITGLGIQTINLVMNDNQIQFVNSNHRIEQNGDNMQIHSLLSSSIGLFLGGVVYAFDQDKVNWDNKDILNMNRLAFSNSTNKGLNNVTIQRGVTSSGGNDASLELDANTGGEIVLRVADEEEYNFGATIADFHDNQIDNAVVLSTVTGVSGITGLGTQVQTFDINVQDIKFQNWSINESTVNTLDFENAGGNIVGKINFNTDNVQTNLTLGQFGVELNVSQKSPTAGNPGLVVYTELIEVLPANDINTTPVYDIRIQRAGGAVIDSRRLLRIRNFTTDIWDLNFNGDIIQSGTLTIGGDLNINKLDADIFFNTRFTQSTPIPDTEIFTMTMFGENDANVEKTFAIIDVNQKVITNGSEDAIMEIGLMQNGSVVPALVLNAEDSALVVGTTFDIGFPQKSGPAKTFKLGTSSINNLLFNLNRVKTQNIVITDIAITQTPVTTTETDIIGLAFLVADQPQGVGIVTLTLLVSPSSNNHQAIFRIKQNNVVIFSKSVRIGDNGEQNNTITFVADTVLDGTVLKATAQAATGTFNVEVGTELSVIQLF